MIHDTVHSIFVKRKKTEILLLKTKISFQFVCGIAVVLVERVTTCNGQDNLYLEFDQENLDNIDWAG